MSKITFRADEDLVERLEALDASKSEAMREALRSYLDDAERNAGQSATVDDALAARVDELISERLDAAMAEREPRRRTNDVNVNVSFDGVAPADTAVDREPEPDDGVRKTPTDTTADSATTACGQCGEEVDGDHVYCPNCGEKTARRAFCDCGDEVRSDWAFCPSCGRRTPAADVLDRP